MTGWWGECDLDHYRAAGLLLTRAEVGCAVPLLRGQVVYLGVTARVSGPRLDALDAPGRLLERRSVAAFQALLGAGLSPVCPALARAEVLLHCDGVTPARDDADWVEVERLIVDRADAMAVWVTDGWDRCHVIATAAAAMLRTNRRVVLIGGGE
ncbi:hypothetical protein [Jannaschia sp. M317]|uniref:hypothetical protein n=1 Tax=Jannaschia sp. M317 TaxID=2867011 RepID=UPI0021A3A1BD|nr:hypothetical protein [Jannaschia sp. M317]UWQ16139.1 hypothetical protein K3551_09315 [Jannaschia sp. M317]